MNDYQLTLKTLVCQMGHSLGCWTAWLMETQRKPRDLQFGFNHGQEMGIRSEALRVIKEILREHPEFRREAGRWIRRGIQITK